MHQASHQLSVATRGRGLYDVTGDVAAWVAGQAVREGLLTLFLRHTSASLVIQENADADVLRDLESFFAKLVPEAPGRYRHSSEGPDDMPAHIRAALTQTQLSIPVAGGHARRPSPGGSATARRDDAPVHGEKSGLAFR